MSITSLLPLTSQHAVAFEMQQARTRAAARLAGVAGALDALPAHRPALRCVCWACGEHYVSVFCAAKNDGKIMQGYCGCPAGRDSLDLTRLAA